MSARTDSGASARATRREQRELSSVGNALRLLEALAQQPDAGISELARALDLSKPTVDRLLVTLAAAGFAEQDATTKRYRLTARIIALADGVRARTTIVAVARPHLAALSERLGETINLATLSGASVVYLETLHANEFFRVEPRPGTTLPPHCTGLGKALLAHVAPARLEELLRDLTLTRYTAATITSEARLREAIEAARRDGYAIDDGEISEDVHCVAVPILGRDGDAIAAVSAMVPQSRFDEKRGQLVEALCEAARRIGAEAAAIHTARARA